MYIKQLQTLLGFDPEKAPKVKKSGNKNHLQSQQSDNQSRPESLKNDDEEENAIKEKAITSRHASTDSSENFDLVKRIELDTEELVKSPYANKQTCKNDVARSHVSSKNVLSRLSPGIPTQQDTSSRSSIKSPQLCTHDYSPNAPASTSPSTNFAIEEKNLSSKSCALEVPASCIQNELIAESSNPTSSDIGREPFDWWDRVCNKSQMNSIFDLVDDCSLNVNKHAIQSHSDNVGWVNKNSRHHPYKRLELKHNALSDNWDDVFQIKVETHTPPPYNDRSEFSCQQQYSSCQRVFTSKYPGFDGTRTKRLSLWKSMKHVSSASYRL